MSSYDINFSATLDGTSGNVTAGYVLCPVPGGNSYVIATTANLASIGRVGGIAIQVGAPLATIIIQYSGEVPASITGLGPGAIAAVRISATGILERIVTSPPAPTDYVMGDCDALGNVTLSNVSYVNPGTGGGGAVTFQEEGVTVVASNIANFVGGTTTVTNVGGVATITAALPTAAGDWTGPITANVVGRVNGATIPASGALVTGNSLRVTGVNSLGYSALNLAGGNNFVTGILPAANVALPVIFDGGSTTSNLRSARAANQSPIDNTKNGIVNLGSTTTVTAGATGAYSTIGGGDKNIVSGDYACTPGGRNNTATGADSFACMGGTATNSKAFAAGSAATASGVDSVAFSNGNASGNSSFAISGCTASGTASFAGGLDGVSSGNQTFTYGAQCTASSDNSTANGVSARAIRNTQRAVANGQFAARGDCQASGPFVIRAAATGATPVVLGGGGAASEQFNLENGKAYAVKVTCLANRSDAAGRAMFVYDLLMHATGGLAVIDNENLTLSVPNGQTYTFAFTVSLLNLVVTFTGTAGQNVNTLASVEFAEVVGF